jgi:hypothetical protein
VRAETGRHGAVALLFEQAGAFVDLPKDRGTALMTAGMDRRSLDTSAKFKRESEGADEPRGESGNRERRLT